MSTINVGQFNLMRVDRKVDFGFYMDDGGEGICAIAAPIVFG